MTLSKNDLNQIDKRLESQKEGILEEMDSKLNTQKEEIFEEMDSKLTKLKSGLFEKIDPILKEVATSREERPLIESRLEALEEIHPKGKHILAS